MPKVTNGKGFTLRSVLISSIITIFVAAASSYIAIMISALPWPIILSVIMAFSMMKLTDRILGRNHSIHETNVAQAGGSVGGLVAAGIAFTIPAYWYLKEIYGLSLRIPSPFEIMLIAIAGGIVGVSLSLPIRKFTIDEENLPYPSGYAGAEVLLATEKGGMSAEIVFIFMMIAIIYAALKSIFIPQGIIVATLTIGGYIIIIAFLPLLVAVGTGYIIGEKTASLWFAGAFIGWVVLAVVFQAFSVNNYIGVIQNIGMGIVFGSGLSFFLIQAFPKSLGIIRESFGTSFKRIEYGLPFISSIYALIILIAVGIPIIPSILAVIGSWLVSSMAGKITGETNVDPLEQFGLMIGLGIMLLISVVGGLVRLEHLILIILFVSVSAALAGDIGHDYKSAQIIGTDPLDIMKIDLIASVLGGIVATISVLIVINSNYDAIFTAGSMLAFQSKLIAETLRGAFSSQAFLVGIVIGGIADTIFFILRERKIIDLTCSIMPLGIGMFLGFALAIPILIGALIHAIIERKRKNIEEIGILAVSGIMGGEGITGFSLGLLTLFGIEIVIIVRFIAIFTLIMIILYSYR